MGIGDCNSLQWLWEAEHPSFGLDVKHWEGTTGRKTEKRLDIYTSPSFSATCYSTFLTILYLSLFTRGKTSFEDI